MSDGYVFKEYPKWIHPEGKPSIIVNNREEEDAILGVKKSEVVNSLPTEQSVTKGVKKGTW